MAQRGIRRHAEGAKERVLLHQSDTIIRHHDPTPSPPGKPPAPPSPLQGTRRSQTDNLPAANADSRVPLPKTQPVNLDALAEDSIHNEDFDPELLTDEEHHVVSTLYTMSECCEHTFGRREQPIECTCLWKLALITRNGNFSAL